MLDQILSFKEESKSIINKIVKYNLHMIAHNGSGLDSYNFHNNIWLEKIGVSYKFQPSLLKQEMDHDETFEDTRDEKNMNV